MTAECKQLFLFFSFPFFFCVQVTNMTHSQCHIYYRFRKLDTPAWIIRFALNSSISCTQRAFHFKSSWSSRDRFRAFKFSSRLWGGGGFLPLRNRTARALIFWTRSNTCKIMERVIKRNQSYVKQDFEAALLCTDEASISATPSQPLPPPCSKSQYFTASFSSSNTYKTNNLVTNISSDEMKTVARART